MIKASAIKNKCIGISLVSFQKIYHPFKELNLIFFIIVDMENKWENLIIHYPCVRRKQNLLDIVNSDRCRMPTKSVWVICIFFRLLRIAHQESGFDC